MEPVYDSKGDYRGNTKEGYKGKPIIYDGDKDFSKMSAAQLIGAGGKFIDVNALKLTAEAYAKIVNEIVGRMPELGDMGLLRNSSVSIYQFQEGESYNGGTMGRGTPFSTSPNPFGHNFPVQVTVRMNGNKVAFGPQFTVENIQNAVAIHEFMGHGFLGYGDGLFNHYKVYELQMKHPTWKGTTPDFKRDMKENYNDYMKGYRSILKN